MNWFIYISNYRAHIIRCSDRFMFWLWSHTSITEFRVCSCKAEAEEYKHFYNYGGK